MKKLLVLASAVALALFVAPAHAEAAIKIAANEVVISTDPAVWREAERIDIVTRAYRGLDARMGNNFSVETLVWSGVAYTTDYGRAEEERLAINVDEAVAAINLQPRENAQITVVGMLLDGTRLCYADDLARQYAMSYGVWSYVAQKDPHDFVLTLSIVGFDYAPADFTYQTAPNEPFITRREMVTLLYDYVHERPANGDDALVWAVDNGLIQGYGNGDYGFDEIATQEQIYQFVYNWVNARNPLPAPMTESDAPSCKVSGTPWWAAKAVNDAYNCGYFYRDYRFDGKTGLSKADFLPMLAKAQMRP